MEDNDRNVFLLKEIDILQSVIGRMTSNSFLIKGWTITLVVGVFLLKGVDMQVFIAFIPIVMFWLLDSYFLRQKRLFRARYKWRVDSRMELDEKILDIDTCSFKQTHRLRDTFFSKTLVIFYLPISIITLIVSTIYLMNIYCNQMHGNID